MGRTSIIDDLSRAISPPTIRLIKIHDFTYRQRSIPPAQPAELPHRREPAAVLAGAAVVFKAATKPGPQVVNAGDELSSAPIPQTADADSPADTIKSLRGQVEQLQFTIEQVNQQGNGR